MKNTISLALLISLSLFLSSCQSSSDKNDPSNKIVSTYKGGKVTLGDAQNQLDKLIASNKKLRGITFEKLGSDQKEIIIKEVVLKEISIKEAKKRNLHKEKDYKAALKLFQGELLQRKLYIDLVKEATTEENLKKKYDEIAQKTAGKKELKVSYIVVKTKKLADKLFKKLKRSPKSFYKSAKKFSLDKKTAKKGGDLGYVLSSQLPGPLAKISESLKNNQVSKPVLLAKDKWVLIKINKRKDFKLAKYKDIKKSLIENISQETLEKFNSSNVKKAEINIILN